MVEAGLGGGGRQGGAVADRATLAEVGRKQPLLDRRLAAVIVCHVKHPVGVEGVAPAGAREVEADADLGPLALGLGVHLARLLERDAAPPRQLLVRQPGVRGDGGVELERAPAKRGPVGLGERLHRPFQVALSDVAPRTDHVRPHLDHHLLHAGIVTSRLDHRAG